MLLFLLFAFLFMTYITGLLTDVTDRCNCNVMTVACYFKTVYQFNLQFTANC